MKELAKGKNIEQLDSVIDEHEDLLEFDVFILSQIILENDKIKKIQDEKLKQNDELSNNKNINISENESNKELSEKKIGFTEYENDKNIITQLLNRIDILEEEIAEIKEKEKKKEKKYEKYEKYEEKISMLNKKVETLTDIHKKIYFRDVSKYYINEFARINNIDGKSTYDKCQNILNSNFSKSKDKNIQKIISKIIAHYLNSNIFTKIEYFLTNSIALKKEILVKEVENSYMSFMKFKEEEKTLLGKKIRIINASFV